MRFKNRRCRHSLLFCWQMSPLLLASILGVHFSRRGSDQPCSLWWLEIVGNWVSPSSPCALVSDSLSMVSSRYSTGSRLPGWPVGSPYYREKNGASHTHGQAVVFLHWAEPSTLWASPWAGHRYSSVHSGPVSLHPSRVPTRSPCTSYKVTWLSTWLSATQLQDWISTNDADFV